MEKTTLALAVDSAEALEALRQAAQTYGVATALESPAGAEPTAFLEQIARLRPGLVCIENTRLWSSLHRVVDSLRSLPGEPSVILIHRNPDPETILEAMRAGVAEFIYPPFEQSANRSFERLLQGHGGPGREVAGKTLGFLSVKGGCGATTLACHVAAELHRASGSPTLLADFDPELGIVDFLLKTRSQYSVADALQNAQRLDRSMWQAFVATGPGGLSVLSAPEEPGAMAPDPHQFARFFRFVRSEYDQTVIDLGRGVNRISLAAMANIDCTCLVTTMEIPALHRARAVIRLLLNGGSTRERMRLIVNQLPRRQDVSMAELEQMLGFPVYATVAADPSGIEASYTQNGLAAPGSLAGKQMAALATRMSGQPAREQRKFRLFARA